MKGDLDTEEFRFLLTGGIALGGEQAPAPAEWISEKSWGEIIRLNDLPKFKGLLEHFRQKHASYKPLYDSPAP